MSKCRVIVGSLPGVTERPLRSIEECDRSHGDASNAWLVLDYGDIIVHLFREQARDFYDLDGLWADAPQLESDSAPGDA